MFSTVVKNNSRLVYRKDVGYFGYKLVNLSIPEEWYVDDVRVWTLYV